MFHMLRPAAHRQGRYNVYIPGGILSAVTKNIFCILPPNVTMYTTSRLIYPSRKSSVCLSGQLKFHSPKIIEMSNHFSLLFCLVVHTPFWKKTLIQCNLSRKEKSNHCSAIEMNLKMGKALEILISSGHMSHLPSLASLACECFDYLILEPSEKNVF